MQRSAAEQNWLGSLTFKVGCCEIMWTFGLIASLQKPNFWSLIGDNEQSEQTWSGWRYSSLPSISGLLICQIKPGSDIGVDICGRDFLPIYIWLNTQPCLFKNLNKGSVLVVSSCGISLVKLGPRRLGPGPRTVRPWSPIVHFEKNGHLGLRAQLFGDQPIRGPICPEPWNHEMWNEWAGYVWVVVVDKKSQKQRAPTWRPQVSPVFIDLLPS